MRNKHIRFDILKASSELRIMRDIELLEQKGKGRATYYVAGYKFTAIPANGAIPDQLPDDIQQLLKGIGKRTIDKDKMNTLLVALCNWKPLSLKQLSQIVQRNEKYLLENFVTPLREAGELEYTIPDMPNHPEQAYKAKVKGQ